MRPDPLQLIQTYYDKKSTAYEILITHSRLVAEKAQKIAIAIDGDIYPNMDLIQEACLLHDIGVYQTNAAGILCHGEQPYIRHGIVGREILDSYGLFKHALICERHIGAGISAQDVRDQKLPLPERDMIPLTTEEKIVCLADNFYSKNPKTLDREKSLEQVRHRLEKHGSVHVERLDHLIASLGYREN